MPKNSERESRIERARLFVTDLEQAVMRLQEALVRTQDSFIRDAAIKRFEFCFELAWKSIQAVARLEGQECASPRSAFTLSWQNHWVKDEGLWLDMLDARNKTTHTYREATAREVFSSLPGFLPALDFLCRTLISRLQDISRS
jgi:nucleotidyltransferase substrate binding protein (TIGR01987 family)